MSRYHLRIFQQLPHQTGASLQTFQPYLYGPDIQNCQCSFSKTFQLEQVRKAFSKEDTSSPDTSIEYCYYEMQQSLLTVRVNIYLLPVLFLCRQFSLKCIDTIPWLQKCWINKLQTDLTSVETI